MTMPSRAERATISAQETFKGHSASRAALIVLTYLKFLIPKLLSDACSDATPVTVSSKSDASHDCKILTFLKNLKPSVNLFNY